MSIQNTLKDCIVQKFRFSLVLIWVFFVAALGFAQEENSCEAGLRPIEDAMGTSCVSENPQRVIALEWTYVEDLLALGVQPVGVADIEGYGNWVNVPIALDESVADVGTRQEPNLERIAELAPDLIITASFRAANNYDELTAIAPVIAFDPYPVDGSSHFDEMLVTFRTIAQAVNREAEGETVLAEMEAHFAAAQAALETAGRGGENFILSQGWMDTDVATFRLFTDNAMAVELLAQIGLANAWDDAPQQYGFSTIGIEGFAEIGDTNFFYVAQEADNTAFEGSALWGTLPFVQAEHNYWLGGDVWLFGGPLSARLLVDTVLSSMGIALPETEATDAARSIEHVFGVTEIPTDPQRIIAADLGAFIPTFGTLAALGVQPVAVTANQTPAYLDAYLEGVDILEGQVSYEALLTYNPDLIITPGVSFNEENYTNLALIAPTVAPNWYWQTLEQSTDYWRSVAHIVNKDAEVETIISDLEARIASLNAELALRMEGKTVSVFQVQGTGLAALYLQTGRLESALLHAIGIERPANQTYDPANPQWYLQLSPEVLNEVDAWAIFVEVYAENPDDIPAIRAELEANPLWQSLEAVRNNRVFYVLTDEWSGTDPFVANLILDTIENNLTAALDAEAQ
jgi:ABC-type Fe3+-hydroxamate transport system substrate-binding protein